MAAPPAKNGRKPKRSPTQVDRAVAELSVLQDRLRYVFQDEGLLRLALTHASLAHDQGTATVAQNNQRLEFLGDAVLQLVISTELFARFPEADEGPLTKARAHLVNRSILAGQGRRLDLGRHMLLSRGEEATGGRRRSSTLADAFEALIGALFLDGGLEVARGFILAQFQDAMGDLGAIPNLDNPKGDLQEILQANSSEAPVYRLESTSGPDHDRMFVSVVTHRGVELGRGQGRSKKEAEGEAARSALAALRAALPDPHEPRISPMD
jgi:ribonuclease III